MIMIGFTGPAGSGKTTAAMNMKKLLEGEGRISKICPLAQPLKDIARQMGWQGNKDKEGRKLLQMLGTDIGRNLIGETTWISLHYKIVKELSEYDVVLVDDVRFNNEADYITKHNGYIISLRERGYYLPKTRFGKFLRKLLHYTRIKRIHPSELPIDEKWTKDYCIDNKGTLEDLEWALMEIMTKIIMKGKLDNDTNNKHRL